MLTTRLELVRVSTLDPDSSALTTRPYELFLLPTALIITYSICVSPQSQKKTRFLLPKQEMKAMAGKGLEPLRLAPDDLESPSLTTITAMSVQDSHTWGLSSLKSR